MKKLSALLILIVLPFVLSGCFNKEVKEESSQNQEDIQAGGGIKINEPNTIMGWLKSGRGVECEIMSPEGDRITVLAMENKVKISGFPYADMNNPDSEELITGHSLTVDNIMYMWGGKSGMKMDMKRMEEIARDLGEEANAEEPDTWEDMAGKWDENNVDYNCKEKRLSENEFEPPADVEFSDFTAFLEGMADMGMQMKDNLENNEEFDIDALKQQAEDLKAQYGIEE